MMVPFTLMRSSKIQLFAKVKTAKFFSLEVLRQGEVGSQPPRFIFHPARSRKFFD